MLLNFNSTFSYEVQFEHEEPYDYYRYTYYALDKLFLESKFNIIKIDYIGDSIGVFIISFSNLLNLLIKFLNKIKLGWMAALLQILFKIPEYIYYYCIRLGLDLKKIYYFKRHPLGFTFFIEKND